MGRMGVPEGDQGTLGGNGYVHPRERGGFSHVKTHQIVHSQSVEFTACQLHLNNTNKHGGLSPETPLLCFPSLTFN
jgi:hypothetical protein